MIRVVESKDAIEVQSETPTGKRIVFIAMALFPLIAPYELIIKPDWHNYLNVFFLFALAISLGALSLTALLAWAAITGLNTILRFDRLKGVFAYSASSPILPWRTVRYPIDSINQLHVEKQDWSEGAPSYSFAAKMRDGRIFKSDSSWQKEEIEKIVNRVSVFLGR